MVVVVKRRLIGSTFLAAILAGCAVGSRAQPRSAGSGTDARPSRITIDANGDETFSPSQEPTPHALTPAQAWASYAEHSHLPDKHMPDKVKVEFGTLSLVDNFADRPVWAFVYPNSGCDNPNPYYSYPPQGCDQWTFLDAATGELVNWTYRARDTAAAPDPVPDEATTDRHS